MAIDPSQLLSSLLDDGDKALSLLHQVMELNSKATVRAEAIADSVGILRAAGGNFVEWRRWVQLQLRASGDWDLLVEPPEDPFATLSGLADRVKGGEQVLRPGEHKARGGPDDVRVLKVWDMAQAVRILQARAMGVTAAILSWVDEAVAVAYRDMPRDQPAQVWRALTDNFQSVQAVSGTSPRTRASRHQR